MKERKRTKTVVRVLVVVLACIAVVMVARRALTVAGVLGERVHPTFGAFDAWFQLHPIPTLLHILPAGVFVVLAPLQFVASIRSRHPALHRSSGRALVLCGLVVGLSALYLAFAQPIGGANETAATVVFGMLFLFALLKGFGHARRREIARHREWMLRMFSIALAVATVRPIVGMFFAFTELSPREFFGTAFWLGFTLHLVGAEVWIQHTRRETDRLRVS